MESLPARQPHLCIRLSQVRHGHGVSDFLASPRMASVSFMRSYDFLFLSFYLADFPIACLNTLISQSHLKYSIVNTSDKFERT